MWGQEEFYKISSVNYLLKNIKEKQEFKLLILNGVIIIKEDSI